MLRDSRLPLANETETAPLTGSSAPVNAILDADSLVTPEPTPKPESRRGWRRRRVRRGKS